MAAATGSPGATRTPVTAQPTQTRASASTTRPATGRWPRARPGRAVDGVRDRDQHRDHQQHGENGDGVGVGRAESVAQERHPGADVHRVAERVEAAGEGDRDAEVEQLEQGEDPEQRGRRRWPARPRAGPAGAAPGRPAPGPRRGILAKAAGESAPISSGATSTAQTTRQASSPVTPGHPRSGPVWLAQSPQVPGLVGERLGQQGQRHREAHRWRPRRAAVPTRPPLAPPPGARRRPCTTGRGGACPRNQGRGTFAAQEHVARQPDGQHPQAEVAGDVRLSTSRSAASVSMSNRAPKRLTVPVRRATWPSRASVTRATVASATMTRPVRHGPTRTASTEDDRQHRPDGGDRVGRPEPVVNAMMNPRHLASVSSID